MSTRTWGVYGPEQRGKRWRIRVRAPHGEWRYRTFARKSEAEEYKRAVQLELDKEAIQRRAAELYAEADKALAQAEALEGQRFTVSEVMAQYECYMRFEKQNKWNSVKTALFRMRALLRPVWDEHIATITVQRAREVYQARVSTGVSAATHRAELRDVRTMWRWLHGKGWVITNPWGQVAPVGRVRRGKEQLRGYEARQLSEVALCQAQGMDMGDERWAESRQEGALAVLCALFLGMRAGEVVALTVRDVADGEVYIARGKTENATRRLWVPEPLWSLLHRRALAVKRAGRDRLFEHRREWVRDNTKRLCRAAGVPEVCAHSLRGLHATLATEAGIAAQAVAAQLGHATPAITQAHYTRPEATTAASQRAVLRVLQGGHS